MRAWQELGNGRGDAAACCSMKRAYASTRVAGPTERASTPPRPSFGPTWVARSSNANQLCGAFAAHLPERCAQVHLPPWMVSRPFARCRSRFSASARDGSSAACNAMTQGTAAELQRIKGIAAIKASSSPVSEAAALNLELWCVRCFDHGACVCRSNEGKTRSVSVVLGSGVGGAHAQCTQCMCAPDTTARPAVRQAEHVHLSMQQHAYGKRLPESDAGGMHITLSESC